MGMQQLPYRGIPLHLPAPFQACKHLMLEHYYLIRLQR